MKKKLYWITPILLSLVLVFSIMTVSAKYDKEVTKRFFDKNTLFERVIADDFDKEDIEFFMNKGCLLIHKLKRSSSFECPKDIVSELNVRKSRIFHITDLNADEQIGADKVWAEGITGSGVNVAILDTGIDTDHPELQDSYLGGYDFVNNDPYPEDDHGHGTHISGIITSNGVGDANSKGVSPGAGIYMYKVCNVNGNCYEDDMMAAMEDAVYNTDAKVMSISIGGGSYTTENCDSDSLAAKVNWVVDQNLTVAIAAGNDGRGVSSPGCASGAIAVGAVNSNNDVVYFSGRGPALDIVAPGDYIYSTLIDGYGEMRGTSMATPHVAGVVSLLLETDSGLTDSEIKTALYETASPVNKCYKYECIFWFWGRCFGGGEIVEVTCTPEITGAGVVNAYEAYLDVKPTGPGPECTVDADCDDGIYCNGVETCVSGSCQTGTPIECSHISDQCNDGICDETSDSCIAQSKPDGTSCDDGLFCNVNETCQAGVCTGGFAYYCDDLNTCTADSCNEETDSCEYSPVTDGTSCNDGQFCTIDDVCTSGVCGGTERDCSDGVACTADSCDEENDQCVNTPDNSYCDDGLWCNGEEICDASAGCQPGTPVNCDDGDECTIDSCDEVNDMCINDPLADDTACAGGICCSGNCVTPVCSANDDCNDGDECTEDTCNNPGTCAASCSYINAPDNTACTGGICCSGTCAAPVCSVDIDCDDSDACTTDTCSYGGTCDASCSNEAIIACIDNDGCCPTGCDYTNDNDCQAATTKCWSSEYVYLKRSSSQFRKFCKCAEGTYGYNSYSYAWGKKTAYQYKDTGDNENWEAKPSTTYFPAYRVRCTDGNWYETNQDYYR